MTDAADLSADDVETAVGASLELIMAHEVGEADVLDDPTSGDVGLGDLGAVILHPRGH